jgi:hypothetical protein
MPSTPPVSSIRTVVETKQVTCSLTAAEVARIEKIAADEDRDRGRQVARLIRMGLKAYDATPAGESA